MLPRLDHATRDTDALATRQRPAHESDCARLSSLLSAMRRLDPQLVEHGARTAAHAVKLGRILDLPVNDLVHLHFAGLLHDVGQITLPRDLLAKEPLTAEEYCTWQCHPRSGAELLAPITFLAVPATWIAHHHERWDGTGYPYGLRGELIPLGARILALTDTYDMLAGKFSDGAGTDERMAAHLLRLVAGSQLDPQLVQQFLEVNRVGAAADAVRRGARS